MEDWVHRALARWPDVPALFGWLGLDRRGRWLIKGEIISRPQIIETIGRNYAADEQGRWYFQNGPQRGYVSLEAAPLILRVSDDATGLVTHTDRVAERPTAAWMDEEGAILLSTEHGAGLVADRDLGWVLERIEAGGEPVEEDALSGALRVPDGEVTGLGLRLGPALLPITRLDRVRAPGRLGFVREPVDTPA